jgi:hypothetical protein
MSYPLATKSTRENVIYTFSSYLQYEQINCTNEISFLYKPHISQYLFLVILDVCIIFPFGPNMY